MISCCYDIKCTLFANIMEIQFGSTISLHSNENFVREGGLIIIIIHYNFESL